MWRWKCVKWYFMKCFCTAIIRNRVSAMTKRETGREYFLNNAHNMFILLKPSVYSILSFLYWENKSLGLSENFSTNENKCLHILINYVFCEKTTGIHDFSMSSSFSLSPAETSALGMSTTQALNSRREAPGGGGFTSPTSILKGSWHYHMHSLTDHSKGEETLWPIVSKNPVTYVNDLLSFLTFLSSSSISRELNI